MREEAGDDHEDVVQKQPTREQAPPQPQSHAMMPPPPRPTLFRRRMYHQQQQQHDPHHHPSTPPRRTNYEDDDDDCGFISEPSESTMGGYTTASSVHPPQAMMPPPPRGSYYYPPQPHPDQSPGGTSLSNGGGGDDAPAQESSVVMQFEMPGTNSGFLVRRKTPNAVDCSMTLSEDEEEEEGTNPMIHAGEERMPQSFVPPYSSSFRQSSVRSLPSVEEDRPLLPDEHDNGSTTEEEEGYIQHHRLAAIHTTVSSLDTIERMYETKEFRGSEQAVLRHTTTTTPTTTPTHPTTTLPTYICPRCGTRQREFFTTDNVDGSFEGPASYLALYFSIYVICSLFIFGLEEGWMPLDCIYFAVLTLTTAGLGDFVPTSTANKLICSIFIYFGVACIGLLLGSYIAGMLDTKATLDRQRQRIDACPQCARIRTQAAATVAKRHNNHETMRRSTFSSERSSESHPINVRRGHRTMQRDPMDDILGSPGKFLGRQKHTRHTSIDITRQRSFGSPLARRVAPTWSQPTEPISDTPTDYDNDDDPTSTEDEDYGESGYSSDGTYSSSGGSTIWDPNKSKLDTAKYVFLTLRTALANSMVIIAVGCVGFRVIEGFSIVDSWYFTTVLLTTVGYGDIVPVTSGGKLFATIYILVAGTVLLNNMSTISMIPLEIRKRRMERAILTQFGDLLDDVVLQELATGPLVHRLQLTNSKAGLLNECTREMFSLAMLVRLGKVSEQDIKETFKAFKRLDVNDEGVLNSKSIIAGMIKQRKMNNNEVATPNPSRTPTTPIPPPPPRIDSAVTSYGSSRIGDLQRDESAHTQQYWEQTKYHHHHRISSVQPPQHFMTERSALLSHYDFEYTTSHKR